jgi:hypothetical protein
VTVLRKNMGGPRQSGFNSDYISYPKYIYISIPAVQRTAPYCRESRDRIDFGLTKYHEQERREFIVY